MSKLPRSVSALALLALVAHQFVLGPVSAGIVSSAPSHVRQVHNGILMLNAVVDFPNPPPPSANIEDKLDYCEHVLAELEAQLPRKSLFRWLFLDRTRLASGYEKEFRFTYDSYPYLSHHHH